MFVLSVIDTLQKADTQAGDWLALWGMSGVIEGRGDALHPGTVCTDLSAPFRRSPKTLFSVERAAKQLQRIVDEASLEMNGSFIAWDGQPIPW